MSSSDQHQFRVIDDMAIPYRSKVNPATNSPRPYFTGGTNLLAQKDAPLSKRPGFPTLHDDTVFGSGVVKRIFTWSRWDGTFYTMFSVIDGADSKVYNGTTLIFTSTGSTEPFDYEVSNNFLFMANGVDMKKWDGTTVTNWGIEGPGDADEATLSNAGAGNVPSVVGHTYVYAYGNSSTGHISDISIPSAATSAANRTWDVSGVGSSDTQVDEVHVYRSEDGSFNGPWFELSNSPIAEANPWTISDNDFDTTSTSTPRLQGTHLAPIRGNNRPPTPSKGPVYFAGRIWTFINDMVHNSGLEEINVGVPEESFPANPENGQSYGTEVFGLGVLADSDISLLLIFGAGQIHYVAGDSNTTFRTNVFAKKRGCRNRATIVFGQLDGNNTSGSATFGFCAWLDSSNAVRMVTTNGGIRNLSDDIQPDIANINHALASMTLHEDGNYRWLLLSDGGEEVIRCLDLQRGEWNVPWPVADCSNIYSGETAAGVWKLFLAITTGAVGQMDYDVWADVGVAYGAIMDLMLASILEAQTPEKVASLEYAGIERNATDILDIGYLADEDPYEGTPTYVSILANGTDPFLRNHIGTNLVERWYYLRDKAGMRRIAIRIEWA